MLGAFRQTGTLKLFYNGEGVADLSMKFLHDGRPNVVRQARRRLDSMPTTPPVQLPGDFNRALVKILGSLNVCSKEWIIRQYDHEVQGGTVIKPLVGVHEDGPGDAAVVTPVLGVRRSAWRARVRYRKSAVRRFRSVLDGRRRRRRGGANVVAVGRRSKADRFTRQFLLGQHRSVGGSARFCWCWRPRCAATWPLAYLMPFISDARNSLKNEHVARPAHRHPADVASSRALEPGVPDVRRCVETVDLKELGNQLFLIGETKNELGAIRIQSSSPASRSATCRASIWHWRRVCSRRCTPRFSAV